MPVLRMVVRFPARIPAHHLGRALASRSPRPRLLSITPSAPFSKRSTTTAVSMSPIRRTRASERPRCRARSPRRSRRPSSVRCQVVDRDVHEKPPGKPGTPPSAGFMSAATCGTDTPRPISPFTISPPPRPIGIRPPVKPHLERDTERPHRLRSSRRSHASREISFSRKTFPRLVSTDTRGSSRCACVRWRSGSIDRPVGPGMSSYDSAQGTTPVRSPPGAPTSGSRPDTQASSADAPRRTGWRHGSGPSGPGQQAIRTRRVTQAARRVSRGTGGSVSRL